MGACCSSSTSNPEPSDKDKEQTNNEKSLEIVIPKKSSNVKHPPGPSDEENKQTNNEKLEPVISKESDNIEQDSAPKDTHPSHTDTKQKITPAANLSADKQESCWKQLSNATKSIKSNVGDSKLLFVKSPLLISDAEIFLSFTNGESLWLIQYNPITDKSQLFIKLDILDADLTWMCLDDKKENIYLWLKSGIFKINLTTKKQTASNMAPSWGMKKWLHQVSQTKGCIIGNQFHGFLSQNDKDNNNKIINEHSIYDIQNGEIWKQSERIYGIHNNCDLDKYSMIHCRSKHKIIFIGTTIILYDLQKDKWKLLNTLNNYKSAFCTISKNEKYVIMLHGFHNVKKISIFDIEMERAETVDMDWPFKIDSTWYSKCKEQIFIADGIHGNGAMIARGYIRKYCEADNVPMDLINLIAEFSTKQCLYVIKNTGEHWKISLNYIFGK